MYATAPGETGSYVITVCLNPGASETRTVRVSEAPGFKQTVMTYDPVSPGAVAYMSVARELAERGKPFDSNVVSINYKREGEIA